MEIGRVFYTAEHVDAEVFAQEVGKLTGEVVPVELVRHWYGRAVPLQQSDKAWGGRAHVFTAQRKQGAKPFTVYDAGTLPVPAKLKYKRVLSGVNSNFEDKEAVDDLMHEKEAEIKKFLGDRLRRAIDELSF